MSKPGSTANRTLLFVRSFCKEGQGHEREAFLSTSPVPLLYLIGMWEHLMCFTAGELLPCPPPPGPNICHFLHWYLHSRPPLVLPLGPQRGNISPYQNKGFYFTAFSQCLKLHCLTSQLLLSFSFTQWFSVQCWSWTVWPRVMGFPSLLHSILSSSEHPLYELSSVCCCCCFSLVGWFGFLVCFYFVSVTLCSTLFLPWCWPLLLMYYLIIYIQVIRGRKLGKEIREIRPRVQNSKMPRVTWAKV